MNEVEDGEWIFVISVGLDLNVCLFVLIFVAQRSGTSKVIAHLDLVDMDITHGNMDFGELGLFLFLLDEASAPMDWNVFTRATEHEVELELVPGR